MLLKMYTKNLLQLKKKFSKKRWVKPMCYKYLFITHFEQINIKVRPPMVDYDQVQKLYMVILNATEEKKFQYDTQNFWFYLYQHQYFSSLFRASTVFRSINSRDVIPYSLLHYMVHSVKLIKWKRYYITHSNEIIEILFLSLWLKNLKLFMEWMRKHFEKTNLKKHKKLFLLLNLLLGRFVWSYNLFFQLKGLRIKLRGKFGKAGSVRKTRRYIRRGKCSYTTKNIAMVSQTNLIRTLTGVYAIKFEVFFRKKWCLH